MTACVGWGTHHFYWHKAFSVVIAFLVLRFHRISLIPRNFTKDGSRDVTRNPAKALDSIALEIEN